MPPRRNRGAKGPLSTEYEATRARNRIAAMSPDQRDVQVRLANRWRQRIARRAASQARYIRAWGRVDQERRRRWWRQQIQQLAVLAGEFPAELLMSGLPRGNCWPGSGSDAPPPEQDNGSDAPPPEQDNESDTPSPAVPGRLSPAPPSPAPLSPAPPSPAPPSPAPPSPAPPSLAPPSPAPLSPAPPSPAPPSPAPPSPASSVSPRSPSPPLVATAKKVILEDDLWQTATEPQRLYSLTDTETITGLPRAIYGVTPAEDPRSIPNSC
ncbi:hypothetical protein FN846DRAFT_915257 [Sphaerosporella brunnea]|uniref:Uncharacterized protein n=1 Tax=Sphaerosporella brunnea TaxID=1250544 RepID=A0A5J5EBI5_9PEZI|nr:hypothetical protein FN846DRAFT_915257 [Sphaerosporella brunnea]